MKERGILMTGPMIKATQDGRKTQTRRVIKPQPKVVPIEHRQKPEHELWPVGKHGHIIGGCVTRQQYGDQRFDIRCPYGGVGDRLYLKESHYRYGKWAKNGKTKTGKQAWRFTPYAGKVPAFLDVFYDAEQIYTVRPNSYQKKGWYKRSALFMPKKFARFWLEITETRVERVQDIDAIEAEAEGIRRPRELCPDGHDEYILRRFERLWDSINAKRGYGWQANPWVWVVTFKKSEE